MGIFNRKNRTSTIEAQTMETTAEEFRSGLSLVENEGNFLVGASALGDQARDRHAYDRLQVMDDCLDAWRFNPLARRIIELTTQYVSGGGMQVNCGEAHARDFLVAFWRHPLNRMDARLNPEAAFQVLAGDISARDNGALAEAGSKAAAVAQELYAQGLIDKAEVLRLVYRFLGEGGEYVEMP